MREFFKGWKRKLGVVTLVLMASACFGCQPAQPATSAKRAASHPESQDAPKGKAIADLALREGREQADTILDSLLAGKFDADQALWPVGRKLKGYTSYSIKSQKIAGKDTAQFQGMVISPSGRARFDMTLVKQVDGKWAIAVFSGPDPE